MNVLLNGGLVELTMKTADYLVYSLTRLLSNFSLRMYLNRKRGREGEGRNLKGT